MLIKRIRHLFYVRVRDQLPVVDFGFVLSIDKL
jgi:hypothetical protein